MKALLKVANGMFTVYSAESEINIINLILEPPMSLGAFYYFVRISSQVEGELR